VPMVMVTHINNPQLDPNLPTSLSPAVVTGLLRNQLNFQGVIISDTLWMGGISNTYPNIVLNVTGASALPNVAARRVASASSVSADPT